VGKKSQGKGKGKGPVAPATQPAGETSGLIRFIGQLLQDQHYTEALRAAQALVETDPRNPLAHAILGSVFSQFERPFDAMRQYEMAIRLGMDEDPDLLRSLAVVSTMARFPMHALQTARLALKLKNLAPEQRDIFESITRSTDEYLRRLIDGYDIPRPVAESAMLLIEESTRALQMGDQERAKQRASDATRRAPGWPVVWNQQATLLFSFDEMSEAFAVLEEAETQGLGNDSLLLATLVRFQSVVGHEEEAQAALARLLAVPAMAIAAQQEVAKGLGMLGRDQEIYDRLAPLNTTEGGLESVGRFLLGVAAANLGKTAEARQVWRNLPREGVLQVRVFLEMLGRNEQPPTLYGRFPYFAAVELVPVAVLEELLRAAQQGPVGFEVIAAAAEYPRLAEALTENFFAPALDPRLATDMLLNLNQPAAADAVRRFATSRLLNDHDRVYAHVALRGAGLDDAQEPASIWLGGRRRDLVIPGFRLRMPDAPGYSEDVARLMQEATEAQEADEPARAAEIYQQVLQIEPDLPEAAHNLGTAWLLAGRMREGEAQVRRALELKPDYVLARCNLAGLELSRGNLPVANALLEPLEGQVEFSLEDVVAYLRVRADLAMAEGEATRAETYLHTLLAFDHENKLAQERLAQLANRPAILTAR
jgi:tetratricopeptide (TPR) repeat protein